jgi:chorismate mutase
MVCRGVRGATTVHTNDAEQILEATRDLLLEMADANAIDPRDVASILFTMTTDLNAVFPAKVARQIGWQYVPVTDAVEIPVPSALPKCIRILLHWNTEKEQTQIEHIYQRDARTLRPDLAR